MLGSLHVAVEHFHYIVFHGHVLRHVRIDHFFLSLAFIESLLHHTAAHGSHLRTMVGIDNGGNDVAAESWTNLIEQSLIVLAALLVVIVTNLKLSAVGSQSAGERRRHARTQVTTYDGGTHEAYLRFFLLEQVDQYVGVWCRGVGEESLAVEHEQFIHAVWQNLCLYLALDACAGNNGVELHAELVGELASLGEQLLRYFGHDRALYLAIYEYVVHIFLSNNLFVQQFLDQSLYVCIAGSERLALLGLEHDVLHGLHLGGRARESALLRIAVDIGH